MPNTDENYMIRTTRLHLIPFTKAHYEAITANDNVTLGKLLCVETPQSWTEFQDAVDALPVLISFFEKLNGDERWGSYFIINPQKKLLVGTGGYKGAPADDGFVEIGYEINAANRSKGYATEAATALLLFAKTQPGIKGVRAHTLASENDSVKVLRKCNMIFQCQLTDPEDGEIWRWETPNII